MKAKLGTLARAIVSVALCGCLSAALGAQNGRRTGGTPDTRNRTANPRPDLPPAAAPSPAGVVTPPEQGYVPAPPAPEPGSATAQPIPADPLELGYWELYDREEPVSITGTVSRVEWTHPNTYIYMTSNGTAWAVESSYIQFRQASRNPAIKAGETITVYGYLPKENPVAQLPARGNALAAPFVRNDRLIRAGEITMVYGQKIVLGRPPSDAELQAKMKCSAFGC